MPGKVGKKGRKIRRNFRYGGRAGSLSNYMQRRSLRIPKGGDGGKWRKLVGGAA